MLLYYTHNLIEVNGMDTVANVSQINASQHVKHQKVVFWHVANTDEVVEDQLEEMTEKALKVADYVKWMAYPPTSQKALAKIRSMPSSSYQEIGVPNRFKSTKKSFFEFPTLITLHQHCVENPLDSVA